MGIEIHEGIDLWKPRLYNRASTMVAGSYQCMIGSNSYGTGANLLVAQVFPVGRGATFDRIAVSVQTAEADKDMRLGIYADDDNDGWPDRLVLDAGTVSLATTGVKEIVIDQHLSAGLYFLAMLTDATAAKIWMDDSPKLPTPLGSGTSIGLACFSWRVAQTYGELPATFPSGAIVRDDAWAIGMRVQSVD